MAAYEITKYYLLLPSQLRVDASEIGLKIWSL